ncbi:MAG: hypothetical protein ACXW13_12490, partial [Burkholderiaceae bacterium]
MRTGVAVRARRAHHEQPQSTLLNILGGLNTPPTAPPTANGSESAGLVKVMNMSLRPLFADRADAGRRLATALKKLTLEKPIVYALPRGGVPVAAEVAAALNAPLDLVLVRKIGAPYQPELAIGALVDGDVPEVVLNRGIAAAAGADAAYIAAVEARELREIERRRSVYLRGRPVISPAKRDAI